VLNSHIRTIVIECFSLISESPIGQQWSKEELPTFPHSFHRAIITKLKIVKRVAKYFVKSENQ
jgi:hypothetical protein